MKRVFTVPTITEAHLIRGVLENEGIDAIIKNEHLAGLAGEIPVMEAWPEVWVLNDSEAQKAEEIISEFQSASPDPDPNDPEA